MDNLAYRGGSEQAAIYSPKNGSSKNDANLWMYEQVEEDHKDGGGPISRGTS